MEIFEQRMIARSIAIRRHPCNSALVHVICCDAAIGRLDERKAVNSYFFKIRGGLSTIAIPGQWPLEPCERSFGDVQREKSNEQAAMPEAGDLPLRNPVACQQRR